MSIEAGYYKCSKRQSVLCHQKMTTASVVRGDQWYVIRR